jgi:hypothetical protein
MLRIPLTALLTLLWAADVLRAQSRDSMPAGHRHTAGMTHENMDSSFTAMKQRGKTAMRVDQDKAQHQFDNLRDGGRIRLESATGDSADIAGIREHFKDIESAFQRGDFAIPMFVHDGEVPGVAVITAKKDRIEYVRRKLARGAELRLRTHDPVAIRAIHEFMAFQRREHRAGGVH